MATPFGMLFEEIIPTSLPLIQPQYDPSEQMSFCLNDCRERVPFITYGFAVMGSTVTNSATKSDLDSKDADPEIQRPRPVGTQTITEIRAEVTDRDQ